MNEIQKKLILNYIVKHDPNGVLIKSIEPADNFIGGKIEYNEESLKLHRKISVLGDEEYVRAYLIVKLKKELGYGAKEVVFEVEKEYSIGRPSKKSARIDLVVSYPDNWPKIEKRGAPFLFVECKAPEKFESDKDFLKGQLFNLSRQEPIVPELGVYYTATIDGKNLLDKCVIVNLSEYPTWEDWDKNGQASNSIIPDSFGVPKNLEYANVKCSTKLQRQLRTDVTKLEFDRLRKELHDVIWGGGGTNNNDVFVILVRLFLCRVYDELETSPDENYSFQRTAYSNGIVESPESVVTKMTKIFRQAAKNYLGYSDSEIAETTPFETKKISAAKVAFVVEQLQDKSLTRNTHRGEGDLLGDFFEGIVSQDFTQTKGQFFTHINLVNFCLALSGFGEEVVETFLHERDNQGRPRIPKVIDPSCGSGAFLIAALKEGTKALSPLNGKLPSRLEQYANMWFGEKNKNGWAREFLYGIEPNADLGMATKVNMILHGDGSTNIFVKSGLERFAEYASKDRSHGLAITKEKSLEFPYKKVCNEEFDFVFTNPPFSISLSGDEKKQLDKDFMLGSDSASENLFIERWYQLLREGGKFVSVIPETILDSSSSSNIRLFLFEHFNIKAVISLPYVAFKPFTSTKTCILFAEKKTNEQVIAWNEAWEKHEKEYRKKIKGLKSVDQRVRAKFAKELIPGISPEASVNEVLASYSSELDEIVKDGSSWIFKQVVECSTIDNYEIFLAEPQHVGYRRRKGLPDLDQPNDMYAADKLDSVIKNYKEGGIESLRFGFRVNLSDLSNRPSLRIDPKYVHLWTKKFGQAFKSSDLSIRIRELAIPHKAKKLSKGPLSEPRKLIDLANVEAKMSIPFGIEEVDEIGSDKIEFGECDIAISKLEPYLGKVVVNNKQEDWIGSPEWLTYKLSPKVHDIDYLRFLLLTPEMLEVYRCLQSGKRHARLSEADFLSISVPYKGEIDQCRIAEECKLNISHILSKRAEISELRKGIDDFF